MSDPEDRKLHRPRDSAATPSTLQIWINNRVVGEDPALWAASVHRLHLESSHTDIAIVLPQPWHDALKVREYLREAVTENNDADKETEEDWTCRAGNHAETGTHRRKFCSAASP